MEKFSFKYHPKRINSSFWGVIFLIITIIVIREWCVCSSIYSVSSAVVALGALYYRQRAIERKNLEIKECTIANVLLPHIQDKVAAPIISGELIEEYGEYGNVTDSFFLVCLANGERQKYSVVEQTTRKEEELIIVTMTPREAEQHS